MSYELGIMSLLVIAFHYWLLILSYLFCYLYLIDCPKLWGIFPSGQLLLGAVLAEGLDMEHLYNFVLPTKYMF